MVRIKESRVKEGVIVKGYLYTYENLKQNKKHYNRLLEDAKTNDPTNTQRIRRLENFGKIIDCLMDESLDGNSLETISNKIKLSPTTILSGYMSQFRDSSIGCRYNFK
jgi:hypothetical protein